MPWLGSVVCLLALPYPIADAGQTVAYDAAGRPVDVAPGEPLYGQDAHYVTLPMRLRDNGDGTVSDLQTGLIWQRRPAGPMTWDEAVRHAAGLVVAGADDWRLPSIKELTSLADFDGSIRRWRPYLDTRFFAFEYGDPRRGERPIDSQYWSSTRYLGRTMFGDEAAFGFNFADAHIKAYPVRIEHPPGAPPGPSGKLNRVLCCRGNPAYGRNDFADHGDGTVTDRATGLTWTQATSAQPMDWPTALAYAEGLSLAGHDDWRLPDAKELQSIVDYGRAPEAADPARRGPAIDPHFVLADPEAWCWTGTTHGDHFATAVYVCFGRGLSALRDRAGRQVDAHGAGALRSDPKVGEPARYREGMGPQRDEVRILNYVRCVRRDD